ncbi:DUF309 domain-containing protein [Desulforapulum autotrophicum]|nr:DUF309 domain-containing protein [Desulforapulum autotrophicum]
MMSRSDLYKITKFDPFENQLCRQIRNELSASLMDSIHRQDISILKAVAQRFSPDHVEPVLAQYIDNRITRYREVIAQIRPTTIPTHDTYAISLLLWDQELFFEVHEWIESKWLESRGAEKQLLQALIRAAGVYVHLEAGNPKRAERMAIKALPPLIQHKSLVPGYFNVDRLIASLEPLNSVPPKLGSGSDLLGAKYPPWNNSGAQM